MQLLPQMVCWGCELGLAHPAEVRSTLAHPATVTMRPTPDLAADSE